jgi:hypothetical protein
MIKIQNRREFLKNLGITTVGLSLTNNLQAYSKDNIKTNSEVFSGIQISPHSLLDEGIDYTLELLQDKGNVNTLLLNPYTFYGAMAKPVHLLADHGVKKVDNSKRTLPRSWVNHSPALFEKAKVKYIQNPPVAVYSDMDYMKIIEKRIHEHDMKFYLRLYEGWDKNRIKYVPNWKATLAVDNYGKQHLLPCFNNPYFREWWTNVFINLLQNYNVDGFQFGFERANSLHHVFMGNTKPLCFCEYCKEKSWQQNIDFARAREGYTKLYEFLNKVENENYRPALGVFPTVLRLWTSYPEILQWEKFEHHSKMEIPENLYGLVKSHNRKIEFGLHLPDSVCRNLFTRASENYADMAPYADFLKLIVYHEIEGSRMKRDMNIYRKRLFPGLSGQEVTNLILTMNGYNPDEFPHFEQMDVRGLGPKYVYNEINRCVNEVNGATKVYAGIGADIPIGKGWGDKPYQSDPEQLDGAIKKAFDAGAKGTLLSREYEEISLSSLATYGQVFNREKATEKSMSNE